MGSHRDLECAQNLVAEFSNLGYPGDANSASRLAGLCIDEELQKLLV